MRPAVFLLLVMVALPSAASDSRAVAVDRREILRLVVASAAQGAQKNWELDAGDELLLSDRTTECRLPQSAAEETRMNGVLQRSIRGEDVAKEEFESRPSSPDEDLITRKGHDVPRAVVAECLRSKGGSRISWFKLPSPPRVRLEGASRIESVFRQSGSRWETRYPQAVGVIYVSDPLFTPDGTAAFVTVDRLRDDIGGAGLFYRLEKRDGRWRIAWEEVLSIE